MNGPRRRRRDALGALRVVAVAAALATLSAFWVPWLPVESAGAAARSPGRLVVSPTSARPGQRVSVTAEGLTPSADFLVEVCGDDALEGSTDCAVGTAIERATSEVGGFGGTLAVAVPPAPCPCVVAAVAVTTGTRFDTPIDIVGAPSAPLRRGAPVYRLTVLGAAVDGGGGPAEWFGGSAHRTLVLRIRNTGTVPVADPQLLLSYGTEPEPVGRVAGLAPGAVRTVRLPVTYPALTVGDATLDGRLGPGDGRFEPFTVTTTLVPWGLLAVALVVLQLVLLAVRNVLRRRLRRRPPGRTSRRRAAGPLTPPGGGAAGEPAPPGEQAAGGEPTPLEEPARSPASGGAGEGDTSKSGADWDAVRGAVGAGAISAGAPGGDRRHSPIAPRPPSPGTTPRR